MSVANISNGRWHRDVTGTYEVRLLKGSPQLFPLLNCSVMVVEVLFVVKDQNPAVQYLLEFENANAKQRVRFTHEELGDEARFLSRSPACVAIEPGQHKFDCLRHCLMQDAQTAPRVAIVTTVGWYRWNTKLLYAHADGMICSECRDLTDKDCNPDATAQLMDLIELEAACSDVPILAANQGLSEVRVELPSHLKRYRLVKPCSGRDGSKAVRAVVEMLLKNKTAAAYFGVAAIVTAVLTNPKFGLFFYGPSGSMKTAWAKILLSFLVPDANERDLVSFHSTTNALLATFSGLSNSVAVVDDYAPVNGYRQTSEEIRRADNFLRTIINGSGRSRCKADGTIREQARTSGLPILTGEALPDGLESLILRTVNVEITKSTFAEIAGPRPNEFEIYQRQAADGTFSKAMWMLVAMSARTLGDNRLELQGQSYSANDCPSRRQLDAFNQLASAFNLLFCAAVQLNQISEEELEVISDNWHAYVHKEFQQQRLRSLEDSPAERLFVLLRECLLSRSCHIEIEDFRQYTENKPYYQLPEIESMGYVKHFVKEVTTQSESRVVPATDSVESNDLDPVTEHHANEDNDPPPKREPYKIVETWSAKKLRVGWYAGADTIDLLPEPLLSVVNELARRSGAKEFPNSKSLGRILAERGCLRKSSCGRNTYKVRHEETVRDVWRIPIHYIFEIYVDATGQDCAILRDKIESERRLLFNEWQEKHRQERQRVLQIEYDDLINRYFSVEEAVAELRPAPVDAPPTISTFRPLPKEQPDIPGISKPIDDTLEV